MVRRRSGVRFPAPARTFRDRPGRRKRRRCCRCGIVAGRLPSRTRRRSSEAEQAAHNRCVGGSIPPAATDRPSEARDALGGRHVEEEVRAHEAPREHRHDGPYRPRQDHAHGRDHQAPGRQGPGRVHPVRPDRQGPGGARARHHDRDRPRGVRDRQPPLRPRRHARARRLHQEHDHRRRPDRRRDPRGLGGRRPHAPDA